MRIFIQTRGRGRDYAFLGDAPEAWWRKDAYEHGTSFEKPTLIFEARAGVEWRCYISGIPSAVHRDQTNRTIRYTLVMEGKKGNSPENESALSLIHAALCTFSDTGSELQARLDAIFTPDLVDQYIAEKSGSAEIKKLLTAAIYKLPDETAINDKFIKRIKDLINGSQNGVAALLNLVTDDSHAKEVLERMEPENGQFMLRYPSATSRSILDEKIPSKMKNPVPTAIHNQATSELSKKNLAPLVIAGILAVSLTALVIYLKDQKNESTEQPTYRTH